MTKIEKLLQRLDLIETRLEKLEDLTYSHEKNFLQSMDDMCRCESTFISPHTKEELLCEIGKLESEYRARVIDIAQQAFTEYILPFLEKNRLGFIANDYSGHWIVFYIKSSPIQFHSNDLRNRVSENQIPKDILEILDYTDSFLMERLSMYMPNRELEVTDRFVIQPPDTH